MEEVRTNIEEFVNTVNQIVKLLRDKRSQNTVLVLRKKNVADKLERSIQKSFCQLSTAKDRKEKLLLSRLKDNFEEAEQLYQNLEIHQRLSEIEDIVTDEHDKAPQTSSIAQTQIYEDSAKEFDLEKLRRRHMDLKQIENAVSDTGEMFRTLSSIVNEQGETVETIEGNVDRVCTDVQHATLDISKARDYHAAALRKLLPFAGAAVGAGITGPVGLAYGFKIGGTATIAISSIFGYFGGRMLSKRIEAADKQVPVQNDTEPHLYGN